MKKAHFIAPLVGALLICTMFGVQAEGRGALKVDLDTASFWTTPSGELRTVPVEPTVGSVIFKSAANGKTTVTVKVKDGQPDTTFEVYLVPPGNWPPDGGRTTVTLNKNGKGTINLQVGTWVGPPNVVWAEVDVINTDDPGNPIGYTTDHIFLFAE